MSGSVRFKKGFRSIAPDTNVALSPSARAPGTTSRSQPRGSAGFARLLEN
jgi:hypothetical protein